MTSTQGQALVFSTKPIVTIMADFGGAYAWHSGPGNLARSVGCCIGNSLVEWEGIPEPLRKELEQWQDDFHSADRHAFEGFDWEDFNRRGIEFAARLKDRVADRMMVIYEKAWEDPNCFILERREVLLGGGLRPLPSRKEVEALLGDEIGR